MKTVLIAGLLAAAMLAPAHAHEVSTQTRGPYVGLGVAAVEHEWLDERKARAKFFVGYNANDRWGMEFGVRQRSGYDVTFGVPGSQYSQRSMSSGRTMYLAGKFTTPITEKLSFQSKLGLSHNKGNIHFLTSGVPGPFIDSGTKNGLYASLGLKYQVTTKVAMTLELERNGKRTYSGDKPDTVSLNASYSF